MGEKPEDTQREIGQLRSDMTSAIDEIQRRVTGGVKGVSGAEARITGARTRQQLTDQVTRQVQEKPQIISVAGTVAVAAVGYAVYALVDRVRESRKPENRLKRQAEDVREGVQGRVEDALGFLGEARRRGVLLKVKEERGGYLRVTDAKLDLPKERKTSDMVKKLLWAALLSVFMAVGSVAARRVAESVWRASVREAPPTEQPK